jgi:hypothetical protein
MSGVQAIRGTGATGLEPATSGVTDCERGAGARILRAIMPVNGQEMSLF